MYGVLSKQFAIGAIDGKMPGSQLGLTLGYGNGLFSDDGGLGDAYNDTEQSRRDFFLAGGSPCIPSLNTSLDFMVENDGFDYNAGLVYDWRGLSAGLYGTELEEGGKKTRGFGVYNYTKFNVSLGYSGNIIDISRGVLLRTRITELTREQQRLNAEIAARKRRIAGARGRVAEGASWRTGGNGRTPCGAGKSVQEERDAIQRAEERLRSIQQNPSAPTTPPATSTPPQNSTRRSRTDENDTFFRGGRRRGSPDVAASIGARAADLSANHLLGFGSHRHSCRVGRPDPG